MEAQKANIGPADKRVERYPSVQRAVEAVPFYILRNLEERELCIFPFERTCSVSRSENFHEVQCSCAPEPTIETLGIVTLRIHTALLASIPWAVPSSTVVPRGYIQDPIVMALVSGIMTSDMNSRHSYTTVCMIKMLLARLSQVQESAAHSRPGGFEDWQVSVIRNALGESREECMGVADIADRCRLSVCHFSRLFRSTYGTSPHRFLLSERIERAKTRLVDTNDPISQIALDCGFADQSSFTRRFKAVAGNPPAVWRRRTFVTEIERQGSLR